MTLSIIIPVYNERGTIVDVIARVRELRGAPPEIRSGRDYGLEREIVVVDDGSTDGTREVLAEFSGQPDVILLCHERNLGKGAAIRTGLQRATGDIILVQDADREYDPADYLTLIEPIMAGTTQVVYGSRFAGGVPSGMSLLHFLGNRFLTWVTNVLYGSTLTDMETCYKVFTRAVAQRLDLRAARWGFDPEITAQILRAGYTIREVPISYRGRTGNDGKKLKWRDGLAVLSVLLWYRLRSHPPASSRASPWD
jgi:glycosyltransferase involved in cell wall biosynthesis